MTVESKKALNQTKMFVKLCSCTGRYEDHLWHDFKFRECMLMHDGKPCTCRQYDGKGELVQINPKRYDVTAIPKKNRRFHP